MIEFLSEQLIKEAQESSKQLVRDQNIIDHIVVSAFITSIFVLQLTNRKRFPCLHSLI